MNVGEQTYGWGMDDSTISYYPSRECSETPLVNIIDRKETKEIISVNDVPSLDLLAYYVVLF